MIGSMFRKAMIGDGSTLNLDFTTGVLDSRLTFTRASTTATYINSSGYVTTAGTNVARFDHDPTTLAPRGLLVEGQATNLLNWSESFATSGGTNNNWANTSITRTTGQDDPANGTTAIRFTASAGNATVISSAAIGTSAARTFSVWLRRVTGTGNIQYTQNNGTNWTTQAITATWTRYTFTHTVDHRVGIRIVTSGDAIEMWGAQLETGSGASSYIPTGASQATRNADSCVMTGTNFSSWFAGATEGVFYAEYEAPRSLGTSDYFCLGTQYAAGTFIGINLANSTLFPQALISPGGGFRISGGISVAASTPMKHAAKWSGANNVLVFANGAVGTAHSATSGTPTLTMFSIGSSSTSGTAATGDYLNACIRRIKFWPVALSNSQIQAITT